MSKKLNIRNEGKETLIMTLCVLRTWEEEKQVLF